jgi:iron complex outermembrane recepter protein
MNIYRKSVLFAATALSAGFGGPALAQDQAEDSGLGNDIVVTARRTEEKLQDVPISITVLNEAKLANNNITSAKDIATYTPGLTTNNRFGSDNTTWTIRGFAQEQRTTATVGTFFADVVAPRGSGATQGGDGAGPGYLFDLSNVQVLKGPQGTLQGRNSTGGAVMIVPKKPTDKFEGFLEGSGGSYDMYRFQGAMNVPIGDTVRLRVGFDHQKRDGYLQNAGLIGFGPHGDAGGSTDYWAARASLVVDITPDIENYTIANWSESKSTGVIPKLTQFICREPYSGITGVSTTNTCGDLGQTVTGLLTTSGAIALSQINYEKSVCGNNFWCVTNGVHDSRSETRTWQVINALSWQLNDSLKLKNIVSYAQFRGDQSLDLFGLVLPVNGATSIGQAANSFQLRQNLAQTRALPGTGGTNAQSSLVVEMQLQGTGDRFNWQGGLYLESNNPLRASGTAAGTQTPCGDFTGTLAVGAIGIDPNTQCLLGQSGSSLGRVGYSSTRTEFRDKAIYFQGIYDLTDKIKFTGGFRYTWDSMRSVFNVLQLRYLNSVTTASAFNGVPQTIPGVLNPDTRFSAGAGFCSNDIAFGRVGTATNPYFPAAEAATRCLQDITKKTSAPTWLLGLDFKPTSDMLVYAKYSRGYRQGGVTPFGLDQVQVYDKEKVDTFEIGAKTSWRGSIPGYFNASAYYNAFRDQQLQIGIQCNPSTLCPQTTAIINAGKSRMQGFEIEAGVTPFTGFKLEASYAYLNTKLQEITDVASFVVARNPIFTTPPADLRPLPVGEVIPNAQPHKLVLSASYTLPTDESIGKITVGGTFVYSSKYRTVSDPAVFDKTLLGANGQNCLAGLTVNSPNTLACNAAKPLAYASDYGVLPGSKVINANINWESVGGMPIDAAFFITNLTNAKTYLHVNVQSTAGFLSSIIGEPRMYGLRLKYRFGN